MKLGVAVFGTAIFVLGEVALLFPPSHEIFPFYSWSMFALVPGEKDQFYVLVETPEGEVEFTRGGPGIRGAQSVVAYNVMQRLGRALKAGNQEETERWRRQFEENFLVEGTRYRVVHRRVDPLIRWQEERLGSGVPAGLELLWEGAAKE
ncbi:MAG: hypothetical protein SNJ84_05035 [Verrucomicrobiia bacterium]